MAAPVYFDDQFCTTQKDLISWLPLAFLENSGSGDTPVYMYSLCDPVNTLSI